MHTPARERSNRGGGGGVFHIYRFQNGYGASVVKHQFSYGGKDGLWELMILRFEGPSLDDHSFTNDTPLDEGPYGYLDDEALEEMLTVIEGLEDPTPTLTAIGFF